MKRARVGAARQELEGGFAEEAGENDMDEGEGERRTGRIKKKHEAI